jgi:hypothetical protein
MESKFREDPDRYLWMQNWKPRIYIFHRPLSSAAEFSQTNLNPLVTERSRFAGLGT